jgi:TM2 domain-containing membrane protein YozV
MNNQPNTADPIVRRPVVAILLSVAATGLGHIYCGRLTKGLILFFVSFAFAPIKVVYRTRPAQHGEVKVGNGVESGK